MTVNKNRDTLIDVARKYYIDGLSQQEIARYLNISRPSVSNLLRRCREEKIVEIRIQESNDSLVNALAERLRTEFKLKSVTVVPSAEDMQSTLAAAGKAAAKLLESRLKDRLKIGLSWAAAFFML